MYKGKKTFFYNGEKLWEGYGLNGNPLVYDHEERQSWEVIIVLPGVEVIPEYSFNECMNLKIIIMNDAVKRIEVGGFDGCSSLSFVNLSRNLEYIGSYAFSHCCSLTSIFIPPSCIEIDNKAFWGCKSLIILGMPEHVELGEEVFKCTALISQSPFEIDEYGGYDSDHEEEADEWIKSINNDVACTLHRVCSSYNHLAEAIHTLVKQKGIEAMRIQNTIGITSSQYLEGNTFVDISEKEIINRYILDMMESRLSAPFNLSGQSTSSSGPSALSSQSAPSGPSKLSSPSPPSTSSGPSAPFVPRYVGEIV